MDTALNYEAALFSESELADVSAAAQLLLDAEGQLVIRDLLARGALLSELPRVEVRYDSDCMIRVWVL